MQATADIVKRNSEQKTYLALSAVVLTILLMSTFNVESNDPISGEFIGAIILCLFCNMCLSTFEKYYSAAKLILLILLDISFFIYVYNAGGTEKQSISTLVPLSVAPFLMFPNKMGTILCFFNLILDISALKVINFTLYDYQETFKLGDIPLENPWLFTAFNFSFGAICILVFSKIVTAKQNEQEHIKNEFIKTRTHTLIAEGALSSLRTNTQKEIDTINSSLENLPKDLKGYQTIKESVLKLHEMVSITTNIDTFSGDSILAAKTKVMEVSQLFSLLNFVFYAIAKESSLNIISSSSSDKRIEISAEIFELVFLPLISHAIDTSEKTTSVEIYETTAADGFCNIIIQNNCTSIQDDESSNLIQQIAYRCKANTIAFKQDVTYLEGNRFILRIPCFIEKTRSQIYHNLIPESEIRPLHKLFRVQNKYKVKKRTHKKNTSGLNLNFGLNSNSQTFESFVRDSSIFKNDDNVI